VLQSTALQVPRARVRLIGEKSLLRNFISVGCDTVPRPCPVYFLHLIGRLPHCCHNVPTFQLPIKSLQRRRKYYGSFGAVVVRDCNHFKAVEWLFRVATQYVVELVLLPPIAY